MQNLEINTQPPSPFMLKRWRKERKQTEISCTQMPPNSLLSYKSSRQKSTLKTSSKQRDILKTTMMMICKKSRLSVFEPSCHVSIFFDTCIFNFNRNFPNEIVMRNVLHCVFYLGYQKQPWFGLAGYENACINRTLQQAFVTLRYCQTFII